ncbi:dTDP-4-amino-4,6-dideoxygalactose transaminase [Pustulibacterium marinum]|uniref:dTDP-4-amino-4,6-dideoxygalactose transaminase n=1 Tax=Pustulibacterium marinum TaxID=1224947 RepID=A0A1I7FW15_9FLAO|nr:DegT/DnrJ/EryC1/StrS family aminotransferase [Pustulibacterium marinum]SFU40340.1 dTDP-4-amino-4,6-dideoxygalactose transaminase [Pustulibacterium marinum]
MIKFLDVHQINNRFEKELKEVFARFLDSGYYVLGTETKKFEADFAAYCGAQFCVGVGNGLDAIRLIFEGYKALGKLQEGDEVLVPANTYIASILAISQAGLSPVLVEPEEETFNLNPDELESKITLKIKAILAVHLYGQLANMNRLNAIAKANNLLLIDDAAQAHGARDDKGKMVGNLCDATAFSFYPTKNLGALGEAGAVTTSNNELFEMIQKLRNYGSAERYYNQVQGFNCRIDEMQAAVLNVKLSILDADNSYRRAVTKRYLSEIKNPKIQLPKYSGNLDHVFHLFVIRCKQRDALKQFLEENGVQTVIHYPIPPHKQQAYKDWNHLSFPITEQIHKEVLSLPISPVMTADEVSELINIINQF